MTVGVDLTRLGRWMDAAGFPLGPITDARLLGGGTQNILVRFQKGGDDFVLRRPRGDGAVGAETMRREARILGALVGSGVPHPRLMAACSDSSVIGATFYIMAAVDGANPAEALPSPYLADSAWRKELGLAMADVAAAIGAIDHVGIGLSDLGHPTGYLARQVARWRSQLDSYTDLPGYRGPAIAGVDHVGRWLNANQPVGSSPGLIHGDLHFANIIVDRKRPAIAAVVDWELSTIGDPLIDLGRLLATWPDPDGASPGVVVVRPWEGFPTASDIVARYAERSGRCVDDVCWYEVLACYKLGIILEGTHARACAGLAGRDVGDRLHAAAARLFVRACERIETA